MGLALGAGGVPKAQYSSSAAIKSGCMSFFEKNTDGSVKGAATSFVGTFTFTCANDQINIVQNSCQPINSSCSIPHGVGIRTPVSAKIGLVNYYSAQGPICQTVSCDSGFTKKASSCDCEFKEEITQKTLSGSVTPEGQCVFKPSNCPSGTIYNPSSPKGKPYCLSKTSVYYTGSNYVVPIPLQDAAGHWKATLPPNGKYTVGADGYLKFAGCLSDLLVPVKLSNGTMTCWPPKETSPEPAWVTATKNLSTGKTTGGVCRTGFLKDYEGKFCVASLTNCAYGVGAMGLRTFDPSAMKSCRFMGCLSGYKTMEYKTKFISTRLVREKKTCQDTSTIPCAKVGIDLLIQTNDTKAYYCAKDGNAKVSGDGYSIIDSTNSQILASEILTVDDNEFSPNLLRTSKQITRRMKATTDLDCRRVNHADLAICQSLATINFQPGFNMAFPFCSDPQIAALVPICAPPSNKYAHYFNTEAQAKIPNILKVAKLEKAVPLATYNCGGPDSMAIDGYVNNQQGSCLFAWSKKVKVFGQCYVPNGKGLVQAGKGCLVESCFSGFAPNPSNRACLKLDTPCYRPDLPTNSYEAYLAEVNLDGNYESKNISRNVNNEGGIARFNRCMIKACKSGYQFVDLLKPVQEGYSGNGVLLKWDRTSDSQPPKYNGFTRFNGLPSNKPLTPQYTDLCLASTGYATYQADLKANFNKGIPGQWCAFGAMAEGVTGYIEGGLLKCKLTSCVADNKINQGSATSPSCVTITSSTFKDSCSNQQCLSAQSGRFDNRCLNTSTGFLEYARKECHLAPANMMFGYDESHKGGILPPDKYYPSAPGGDYLYGRASVPWLSSANSAPQPFARYLPRWSSGRVNSSSPITHKYEYFDVFTQKVLDQSALVDKLNY